jgi:hypothetical protein
MWNLDADIEKLWAKDNRVIGQYLSKRVMDGPEDRVSPYT